MRPEGSLLFGIALRLPSPPTRAAHHGEIGGRRDPLHNAIDLIGSDRTYLQVMSLTSYRATPSRVMGDTLTFNCL